MKKVNIKVLFGVLLILIATSCQDYLDINENPNLPTTAEINLVLPAAIVSSAAVANSYNNYGGHFGGFISNAGGFSGFGILFSYNLTPTTYDGLWTQTYQDPLKDLKIVLDQSDGYKYTADGVDARMNYYAVAQIMSCVNYQRLIDAFGDVAYSEALQGLDNLAPGYTDGEAVYQDLYVKLDSSILLLDTAMNHLDRLELFSNSIDPLFKEVFPLSGAISDAQQRANMQLWERYANTLKLRILLRLSNAPGSAAFVAAKTAELNAELIAVYPAGHALAGQTLPGFLTNDAIVNPGYEVNRPNPTWNSWGRTPAGNLANSSRIPTTYSFAFYNGAKLSDDYRGAAMFPGFPATTPHNQLGNEDGSPIQLVGNTSWNSSTGTGLLKGAGMGQVLMLAAESRFLQAEAVLRGILTTGTVAAHFDAGILASFTYLAKNAAETVVGNPATEVAGYKGDNSSYLVHYTSAAGFDQQLEAIITQKYIAMNMITSDEAWNEFRRTGYPRTIPNGGATVDIASIQSTSPRTDRMITRVKNPSSEQAYNASHYVEIDHFSDLIFWDPN